MNSRAIRNENLFPVVAYVKRAPVIGRDGPRDNPWPGSDRKTVSVPLGFNRLGRVLERRLPRLCVMVPEQKRIS